MRIFYLVSIVCCTLVPNLDLANGAVIEPGSRGSCMLEINPRDVTVSLNLDFSSNPSKSPFRWDTGTIRNLRERFVIPEGRDLQMRCSDSRNTFRVFDVPSLGVECRKGQLVTGSNRAIGLERIECFRDDTPRSQIIRNGNCGGRSNGTKLEIHFRNIDTPYMMYWVCFDEKSSIALYSVGKINGGLIAEGILESGKPRPQFQDPQRIFPFDVNYAYKRVNQDETLAQLLGSQEFVEQNYIPKEQYYFSRGHLFPNGDPIYKYEKDSTFYYINAVPQWQITNAGNWEKVERAVRNLAENLKGTITVWTGTYEVLQLPDINGNLVKLFLYEEESSHNELKKRLPVPKFLWKVAHHEASNSAVAFVQVNNPWAKISTDDILCESICDDLRWVDFQIDDVRRGFTYCCDVNSLKQKIQFMPNIKYTKVLNYDNEPDKTEINASDEDDSDEDDLSNGEQETSSSSESEEDY